MQFNQAADQNLAEMAQRLEAALRRPAKGDESRSASNAEAAAAETGEPAPGREQARPARAEGRHPRGAAAPQKSLYDSLEQEMASLLGRPDGKP
jgi:hypothetical protein